MRRKSIALALAVVIVLTAAVPTGLAIEPFAPFYSNTALISYSLSFSGDLAVIGGLVVGLSGTTYISGTLKLQRKVGSSYTDVKSWTTSAYDDELIWDKSWYVATGYYYRITISASVTRNGTTEQVTATSNNVYCG
ncbi:hypothetical protein FACS18949_13990 [Clostridia bacterium]|nr:hypothetical protein FACS18949_13990 [Clostridia bacterium]